MQMGRICALAVCPEGPDCGPALQAWEHLALPHSAVGRWGWSSVGLAQVEWLLPSDLPGRPEGRSVPASWAGQVVWD